jgi:hypothetical protein
MEVLLPANEKNTKLCKIRVNSLTTQRRLHHASRNRYNRTAIPTAWRKLFVPGIGLIRALAGGERHGKWLFIVLAIYVTLLIRLRYVNVTAL